MKNPTALTLLIVLTCFHCSTAVAQIADAKFQSKTAKVLQTEVLASIAELRTEYERELARLKTEFEAKLNKDLKAAVSKIETAKSESTKANKLDEALELRTLATLADESDPLFLLKPPAKTQPQHNLLPNNKWVGNLANQNEKLSLVISGGSKKVANWNGDKIRVEQINNRHWMKFSNGGYGELLQHEDMLIVLMWGGTLTNTLPTKHPVQLGILYRR